MLYIKILFIWIILLLFNIILYIYNDKLWLIDSILKLNILFIWLISWKLLFDLIIYYNLKKKESYNELYKIILLQIKNVESILDNIDLITIIDNVDIPKLYRLNEIIFILKLIEVNLNALVIIDHFTKEWYEKYVYSLVRMKLKEKKIISNGKWNPRIKDIISSTSDKKIIDKINPY